MKTCWTAFGQGATVRELTEAAPTIAAMALVAKRALDSRPGTRWEELLDCRTNLVLLDGAWGPEDEPRLARFEVKQ